MWNKMLESLIKDDRCKCKRCLSRVEGNIEERHLNDKLVYICKGLAFSLFASWNYKRN